MTIVMRPSCWNQTFGPNGLSAPTLGLCLNFFPSITADFNISSALGWAIQDQWSSGSRNMMTVSAFQRIFIRFWRNDQSGFNAQLNQWISQMVNQPIYIYLNIFSVCANFSYLPAEYGISFTVTLDNRTLINKTISGKCTLSFISSSVRKYM